MDPIKILTELEPVFREAAQLAVSMQATAKHHNKYNTGWNVTDIVTEADLAVQEFLLGKISQTELVDCKLLAEEDTEQTKKFTGKSKYYLALDPIDGTAIYAKGGEHFSVIVSLHDGENLIYTFKFFPKFFWTWRFVNNQAELLGAEPGINIHDKFQNSIIYYSGEPEKTHPKLYSMLTQQGYIFSRVANISEGISGSAMFIEHKVAGFFTDQPNVYDGLVNLHFAKAKGLQIYSEGLNISDVRKRENGLYYPGYYLALWN